MLRLADIDPVTEQVELPSGRVIDVHPADAAAMELAFELAGAPTDLAKQRAMLQRLLPDASIDELKSLTGLMMEAVVLLGTGRAAEAYKRLGESSAPAADAASRRSPLDDPLPISANG